jgi:hypothetical protein
MQWRNATVAIIVSRLCAVKHTKANNFAVAATELYDFITVFGFSAISIVHLFLSFSSVVFDRFFRSCADVCIPRHHDSHLTPLSSRPA